MCFSSYSLLAGALREQVASFLLQPFSRRISPWGNPAAECGAFRPGVPAAAEGGSRRKEPSSLQRRTGGPPPAPPPAHRVAVRWWWSRGRGTPCGEGPPSPACVRGGGQTGPEPAVQRAKRGGRGYAGYVPAAADAVPRTPPPRPHCRAVRPAAFPASPPYLSSAEGSPLEVYLGWWAVLRPVTSRWNWGYKGAAVFGTPKNTAAPGRAG